MMFPHGQSRKRCKTIRQTFYFQVNRDLVTCGKNTEQNILNHAITNQCIYGKMYTRPSDATKWCIPASNRWNTRKSDFIDRLTVSIDGTTQYLIH